MGINLGDSSNWLCSIFIFRSSPKCTPPLSQQLLFVLTHPLLLLFCQQQKIDNSKHCYQTNHLISSPQQTLSPSTNNPSATLARSQSSKHGNSCSQSTIVHLLRWRVTVKADDGNQLRIFFATKLEMIWPSLQGKNLRIKINAKRRWVLHSLCTSFCSTNHYSCLAISRARSQLGCQLFHRIFFAAYVASIVRREHVLNRNAGTFGLVDGGEERHDLREGKLRMRLHCYIKLM